MRDEVCEGNRYQSIVSKKYRGGWDDGRKWSEQTKETRHEEEKGD